ncbi:unnamed protein product, partial [Hydatigera taeniaeformis]|uniref:Peptidase_M1 domain-containing protein n=1 Tax=Hydatigena taeniaeformis TaxID=6205 RepID=A0A0R3X8M9_HYDTA
MGKDRRVRLTRTIKPINYKLEIIPNLSNLTFKGHVTVNLQVLVYQHLTLDIYGTLASDMLGLYYSTYTDENGQTCGVLATQFESVFARRAFPCIDEPDRKATFDITIVALDNQVALSNMVRHRSFVTFDRTPVMSTYLVAMVVGHFEFISSTISTYVARNCSFGKHALTVVEKSLPFYTKLFGYPYPLSKLDLVAIPDFACNAMENWGLITYRETALLIDPKNSSLLSQQKVALTVAHEVSHMWFGNLVTMSWWTDLWLNEGFATWAQYLAVDYCFPNYRVWVSCPCASSDFCLAPLTSPTWLATPSFST